MAHTIRMHRVLRAPAERIYRAFLEPAALEITQEGLPDVIPAEACHLGWQESLLQLAALVEPEIPAGT